MSTPTPESSAISTTHLARYACVYVRQSTPGQVLHHGESTDLQYALVDRAVALGWPRDRIQLFDGDLGHSAAAAQGRTGFEQLMAEISLAHVGIVLSLDASRLARNSSDWHRLVEVCGLCGTLIADGERVYDPRTYHDRLLLGLSGIMSEAELHQLKLRLHAGARHKAERGELRLPLPVGLVRLPDGTVSQDPDAEIQARIRLVFRTFADLGSARAVLRYLNQVGLPLPVRRRRGPEPHPVVWEPARQSRILSMLKNPAYAGAYVYGRSQVDPSRRQPGQPHSGTVRRPLTAWPVCLQDVYPAYIPWAEFVHNQALLRDNQSRYDQAQRGVPRQGAALLQGIVRCGRCGGWMYLSYQGPQGQYPIYRCASAKAEWGAPTCQEVRAEVVDAAVEAAFLAALRPDRLAVALAAVEDLRQQDQALQHQWQLRLERARYEAQRAERQYQAVEPENRLVARTLEQRWEQALRALEQVEHEATAWHQRHQVVMTAADQEQIVALGENLPALWHAATTTVADRKRMLRLIIQDVALDRRRKRGTIWIGITWQTGACTETWIQRRVLAYTEHAQVEQLEQRVRALHAAGQVDTAIAEALNSEGFVTSKGGAFNQRSVWYLRRQWDLPPVATLSRVTLVGTERIVTAEEAAQLMGVYPTTIYTWLRLGRLPGVQVRAGLPWKVVVSPETIDRLRDHVAGARRVRRAHGFKKEAS